MKRKYEKTIDKIEKWEYHVDIGIDRTKVRIVKIKYNRQNIRKGATQSYRGFNLSQPVAKIHCSLGG